VEKHELSKIGFELIADAFKALLQSDPDPDPVMVDKIADREVSRRVHQLAGDRGGCITPLMAAHALNGWASDTSVNSPLSPFCGLQHLTGFRVDEMNPPASNTRHGFVKLGVG
jgi:hypothetical protein